MAKGLDIRRRIRSVKNTKAITKAMEMVAASKMRKAQEAALRTRAYAEKALEILSTISVGAGLQPAQDNTSGWEHFFSPRSSLTPPETSSGQALQEMGRSQRFLLFFITPNKGLCGSLNSNLIRLVMTFVSEQQKIAKLDAGSFDFLTLGKKGRDALIRLGYQVKADYSDLGDSATATQLMPIAKSLIADFSDGQYEGVYVIYTHFYSVLSQKPLIKRILPLGSDMLDILEMTTQRSAISDPAFAKASAGRQRSGENIEAGDTPLTKGGRGDFQNAEYLFEPSPEDVLQDLLPRLTEMQVYQAVLEAQASEQSARMVAMQNATKAAGELVDDLTLTYNKARQAGITQEISEIVGGVEALKR